MTLLETTSLILRMKPMSIEIREVTKNDEYTVNGKCVYKDSNGNWIAREELTEAEYVEFRRHIKIKEDNHRYYSKK